MAEFHLIGQISELIDFEEKSLYVKWSLNAGSNWKLIEGFTDGQTHLSTISEDEAETSHALSHPIDVHYVTTGLHGWPKFEFQVWNVDWLSKCNISAYGFMNVPAQPGYHKLACSTWRPVGDLRRRMLDYVTGYRMHLLDPSDVISNGLNRHVVQTVSMGHIKAELTVVVRDLDKYGVDI